MVTTFPLNQILMWLEYMSSLICEHEHRKCIRSNKYIIINEAWTNFVKFIQFSSSELWVTVHICNKFMDHYIIIITCRNALGMRSCLEISLRYAFCIPMYSSFLLSNTLRPNVFDNSRSLFVWFNMFAYIK